MPKQAINYSKTIMYRIVCKNPEIKDCYVGSTTDFKSRKQQHKICCNCETSKKNNLNVYIFIRNNGGFENFDMLEIEKYKAIDQPDQAKRERYWLEFYGATLNSKTPSRTHKEYIETHKEDKKEYDKKYREENKEQLKLKHQEIITCCCGSELTKKHKLRHERSKKHIQFIEQNK